MALSTVWDETDPDGDTKTVSLLDDVIRDMKGAVRERMEGDPTAPLTGIFEASSFANGPMPRAGSGRIFSTDAASLSGLPQQDGRLAITTDTKRLYHLRVGGAIELNYLNLDGSRTPTANLPMGGKKITGLAAATAAGDAVRFEQAALVDQARTVTGLWTFNRGVGIAPFAVGDATLVPNLNADKLDGNDSTAFAPVVHTHNASAITGGTLVTARGGTGLASFAGAGALMYATSTSVLATLALGTPGSVLVAGATAPSWSGKAVLADVSGPTNVTTTGQASLGPVQAVEAGSVYIFEYNVGVSAIPTHGFNLALLVPLSATIDSYYTDGASVYHVNVVGNTTPAITGTAPRVIRCFAKVTMAANAGNVSLGVNDVFASETSSFSTITMRASRIS